MPDALAIATALALLLSIGVLFSWASKKLRVADTLILIAAGFAIGKITWHGTPLFHISPVFAGTLTILALALIIFDGTAQIRLRDLDLFSRKAITLVLVFTICLAVLFTAATHYLFSLGIMASLLFAVTMVGTAPEAILHTVGKGRAATLLKLESIFNTPLTIILPTLVVSLMQHVNTRVLTELELQIIPFALTIALGIGSGIFIGIILFKLVKTATSEIYAPLAIIVAALLSYVLAETIGGSGVLAVSALGLFFGNSSIKHKATLLHAGSVLAKALYILVFLMTGIMITIPFTWAFIVTSLVLFAAYCAVRFIAVAIVTRRDHYSLHELTLLTLCAPKGIATAAVALSLALQTLAGISTVLNLTLAFILYSNTLSALTLAFTSHENRPH